MKKFEIPRQYRSDIISRIKEVSREKDPRKKDYSPTVLDFGPITFLIARHFGFCYGVENAIEIAYKTLEENPGKQIYLLSEMIHNPRVNDDLQNIGVKFLMNTSGNMFVDWDQLTKDDVVIVPAFGTTKEIENKLKEIGIDPYRYNTTCPFVEKVWKTASNLGESDFTVIVHGKNYHEETRATFSHAVQNAPSVIIRDLREAKILADIIKGNISNDDFYELLEGKYSEGFNVDKDLQKIGVVNQTTMLATETEEISNLLKQTIINMYGEEKLSQHFADTRDTLCYATNDNQRATLKLLEQEADFAIVVGGYNSSNTSHIVELLEKKFKTFFINSADNIESKNTISYFDINTKKERRKNDYLPVSDKVRIILTSGASCPDSEVDAVINKLVSFYSEAASIEDVLLNI
jgi:4-hydroxy-3-methylbut-2-en-1-yl diphosphate reductase